MVSLASEKKAVVITVLDVVVMYSDNGDGKHKGGGSENDNGLISQNVY